jgi:hypothetical protein
MAFTAPSRTGHNRVTRRLGGRANLVAMAATPATAPLRTGDRDHRSLGTVRRSRAILADGARTTIHVARFAVDETEIRLAVLRRPQPLVDWCSTNGISDAVVGGFFTRPNGQSGRPLGEVRTRGIVRRSVAFDAPWDAVRACVHSSGRGGAVLDRRDALPRFPRGDLLQAGPLLVRDGQILVDDSDTEGFSAGQSQFDSDITDGRYPRTAFAITETDYLAVAVDGRARHDVGMTMVELASSLLGMGAITAINLDGGGSSSLVVDGRLCNVPRGDYDVPEPGGRPVVTALTFAPRS